MKPTQTLPQHYRLYKRLSIRENAPMFLLNVVSLAALGILSIILLFLLKWFRPQDVVEIFTFTIEGTSNFLIAILIVLGLATAMMVIHEAFHGIFFWYYTGARPVFGFRGAYAFAAAPDWYMPRTPYLITTLAPLVGITLIGLLLMVIVPAKWVASLIFIVALNAAGAVGDMWVAWWLIHCPPDAFGNDCGDVTSLYIPETAQSESR